MIMPIKDITGYQKPSGEFIFSWNRPSNDNGFVSLWIYCLEDRTKTPRFSEYSWKEYTGAEARFECVSLTKFSIVHFLILLSDTKRTPSDEVLTNLVKDSTNITVIPSGHANVYYKWEGSGSGYKLLLNNDAPLPARSLMYRYSFCEREYQYYIPESMLVTTGEKQSIPIYFPCLSAPPKVESVYQNISVISNNKIIEKTSSLEKKRGFWPFKRRKE